MAASNMALQGLSSRACRTPGGCIQPVRVQLLCRMQMDRCRQRLVELPRIQQRHSSTCRTAIIAAAGRRRRQGSGAPAEDGEPELDMDDVMFNPEGAGEDDDEVEGEQEDELDWEEVVEEPEGEEEELEEYEEAEEGEEEAWDAALADFDVAQDVPLVEAPAAPTKEEQDRQKALAMVRFDETESEAELIVEEVPPEEVYRQKTFEEQTALLSLEDRDTLTRNLQGYAVFPLEFVDLLVSESPDARMILADCFVRDRQDDEYRRPTVDDDVSRIPQHYQLIPWEHTKTGDFLKHIDPVVTLIKMYFVAVADPNDVSYQTSFSEVYSFDGRFERMAKHELKTLGENIKEPVMRIREDGIFIEDAYRVPGVAAVAEGFAGHPEDQYLNWDKEFDIREFVKMGLWPEPGDHARVEDEDLSGRPSRGLLQEDTSQGIEERLEELELMEEMDDMPDVPAVDMM